MYKKVVNQNFYIKIALKLKIIKSLRTLLLIN